jgi:hypothetical protein
MCVRKTWHEILHETTAHEEHQIETHVMIRCAGCGTISLAHQIRHLPNGEVDHSYYPSPVSRKKPSWFGEMALGWLGGVGADKLAELLHEIYQAVDGGQHRLAAMGIRALLEQVMVAKVGDQGTFEQKMQKFQDEGYISLIQRDAMRETIEVGHAAMHRAFAPSEEELSKALDIVEGIMAAIYDHSQAATTLAKRVPPKATKGKKTP